MRGQDGQLARFPNDNPLDYGAVMCALKENVSTFTVCDEEKYKLFRAPIDSYGCFLARESFAISGSEKSFYVGGTHSWLLSEPRYNRRELRTLIVKGARTGLDVGGHQWIKEAGCLVLDVGTEHMGERLGSLLDHYCGQLKGGLRHWPVDAKMRPSQWPDTVRKRRLYNLWLGATFAPDCFNDELSYFARHCRDLADSLNVVNYDISRHIPYNIWINLSMPHVTLPGNRQNGGRSSLGSLMILSNIDVDKKQDGEVAKFARAISVMTQGLFLRMYVVEGVEESRAGGKSSAMQVISHDMNYWGPSLAKAVGNIQDQRIDVLEQEWPASELLVSESRRYIEVYQWRLVMIYASILSFTIKPENLFGSNILKSSDLATLRSGGPPNIRTIIEWTMRCTLAFVYLTLVSTIEEEDPAAIGGELNNLHRQVLSFFEPSSLRVSAVLDGATVSPKDVVLGGVAEVDLSYLVFLLFQRFCNHIKHGSHETPFRIEFNIESEPNPLGIGALRQITVSGESANRTDAEKETYYWCDKISKIKTSQVVNEGQALGVRRRGIWTQRAPFQAQPNAKSFCWKMDSDKIDYIDKGGAK